MTKHFPFVRLWGMPVLLAGLTLFGLFAALLGSGLWQWAAWCALAVPLLLLLRLLVPLAR